MCGPRATGIKQLPGSPQYCNKGSSNRHPRGWKGHRQAEFCYWSGKTTPVVFIKI